MVSPIAPLFLPVLEGLRHRHPYPCHACRRYRDGSGRVRNFDVYCGELQPELAGAIIPNARDVALAELMTPKYSYLLQLIAASALACVAGSGLMAIQATGASAPAVVGLDHIPIAVRDLEAAAETYRGLGFALKPGRPHQNGIRNQHVKFPDGTELELITAPEARDALTTTYRRHLDSGDGPAFLALYAPDRARVPRDLHASLGYLFFGPRNASPTDRPEHFAHPNTAASLIVVWLAGDDLLHERTLFTSLGATVVPREVRVPARVRAEVARFVEGEVVFLPGTHQRVRGRRIVGATVRVRSLAAVRKVLESRRIPVSAADDGPSESLFVAPASAHGIWLEFREGR